jgi:hypothetical protein
LMQEEVIVKYQQSLMASLFSVKKLSGIHKLLLIHHTIMRELLILSEKLLRICRVLMRLESLPQESM